MPDDRTIKRADRLFEEFGMIFNGQDCIKDDFNVHWTELTCDTDEEFEAKVESIRTEQKRRSLHMEGGPTADQLDSYLGNDR